VPARALPRSLDPLPGEALDGFLLRLAYRLELSPGRLTTLAGLGNKYGLLPMQFLMHLPGTQRDSLASASRLTPAEAAELCLSALAGRYLPAEPTKGGNTVPRPITNYSYRWILGRAGRYCPACLAGDGSEIQRDLGGPWKKAWRLPVVFACTVHNRMLEELCPGCSRPPQARPRPNGVAAIPQPGAAGIHPAHCRQPRLHGAKGNVVTATCKALLGHWSEHCGPGSLAGSNPALKLQQRIDQLLDIAAPDQAVSCGSEATARQYFADLRLVVELIQTTWPRVQEFTHISPAIALAITEDLRDREQKRAERGQNLFALYDSPPAQPWLCAAVLGLAGQIMDCDRPRVLGECVQHMIALSHRQGKGNTQQAWTRKALLNSPHCSPGFSRALSYMLQNRAPKPRRHKQLTTRSPIRRTRYNPDHVAAFLEDSQYELYLDGMQGIAAFLLRRAAAVRLCQIAAGGSVRDAARQLGITPAVAYAATTKVHGWAAMSDDPAQFETALYGLADELDRTVNLTNFGQRRRALRSWSINIRAWAELNKRAGVWQHLIDAPESTDRRRQTASIMVWARITQGERLYAPQPICETMTHKQKLVFQDADKKTVSMLRTGRPITRIRRLKCVLDEYADALASQIDEGICASPASVLALGAIGYANIQAR
jgi:TniQ